jgi:hypothetical protein
MPSTIEAQSTGRARGPPPRRRQRLEQAAGKARIDPGPLSATPISISFGRTAVREQADTRRRARLGSRLHGVAREVQHDLLQ